MKKLLLASCIFVLVASPAVSAESVPLSDAQLNTILANCAVAQVSLGRVQQSDKPVRINRGYRYDTLLKLMVKFNTRAAQSRLDAPGLLTTTSSYEKEIRDFTQTYTEYDDTLSDIQKMNCKEIPTDFYDKLTLAREKRMQLEGHVIKLDILLDEYMSSVDHAADLLLGGSEVPASE